MFDIAQAAIGMGGSGPAQIIPKGYNGTEFLTFIYLNGIVLSEQPYLEDMPDFIDAVRSRNNPVAPVEVGCSTNKFCCLGNIGTELKRPVK